MTVNTRFLELPDELLLQIFSYLDLHTFLSLTSTNRAFHEYLNEPEFWSKITRETFRVANQPVVEHDGARWRKLYRRMSTQSRVYTWGNDDKSCLGHAQVDLQGRELAQQQGLGRALRRRQHVSWPEEMQGVAQLGVISDIQCGGWSTTLLTSRGSLHTAGAMDGTQFQLPVQGLEPLHYPPSFPPPHERYDASTAIRQFSAGRTHVLAISDSGRIWSWHTIRCPAFHVKFLNHDVVETGATSGNGVVKKVVAGWNKSGALIEGSGIVIWEPLKPSRGDSPEVDTALVLESAVVMNTQLSRRNRQGNWNVKEFATLAELVGEVVSFVILEEVLLFSTDLGKAFAARILWHGGEQRVDEPIELPLPVSVDGNIEFVNDIQGSFRSFAIFTRAGAVLTCKQDLLLEYIHSRSEDIPLFARIPALQDKGVIQLAFGDYHFHALHAPGYVTSYGVELQHCGALGIGGPGGEGRLRGLQHQGRGDVRLVQHALTEGRQIWFQKEKREWLEFLTSGGADPAECMERVRMAIGSPDFRCQGEVSEWIEQQGRDWEGRFGIKGEDDDTFGAYFALSVTAAGWHSGALVLVNEELAAKVSQACEMLSAELERPDVRAEGSNADGTQQAQIETGIDTETQTLLPGIVNSAVATVSDYSRWFLGIAPYGATNTASNASSSDPASGFGRGSQPINYGASSRDGVKYIWANDHFPRLVLSDGTEMPGSVPFDEWRYPRPEWKLDIQL